MDLRRWTPLHDGSAARTVERALMLAFGLVATTVAALMFRVAGLRDEPFVVGVAVCALGSAAIARWAFRGTDIRAQQNRAFAGMIALGPIVAFAVTAWLFVSGVRYAYSEIVGAVLGGTFLGIVLACALVAFVHLVRGARMHPTHDVFERAVARVAGGTALVGAASLAYFSPSDAFLGLAPLGFGIVALVLVVMRDLERLRFIRRIHEGHDRAYSLAAATDYPQEAAAVMPLVDVASTDAVLMREDKDAAGPYRGPGGPRPVAALHFDAKITSTPVARRLSCAAFAGIAILAVGVGAARVGAARERARVALADAWRASADRPRIACPDARQVFEHEIGELRGVDRVLALTHAEDQGILPGAVIVYVLPLNAKETGATLVAAQATADAIPCNHEHRVAVAEPPQLAHEVEARVEIAEKDRGDPLLAEELKGSVRRIFDGASRDLSDTNRVDFGFRDKTIGWRVRYALKQRVGVVALTVDGQAVERQLEATEIPTLGKLTIRDARTGREL